MRFVNMLAILFGVVSFTACSSKTVSDPSSSGATSNVTVTSDVAGSASSTVTVSPATSGTSDPSTGTVGASTGTGESLVQDQLQPSVVVDDSVSTTD